MATKAKNLRKKLHEKQDKSPEKKKEINSTVGETKINLTQNNATSSKDDSKKEEDPLEYFNSEHIKLDKTALEDILMITSLLDEKAKDEQQKTEEAKKPQIPGANFKPLKINLKDLLNARNKIKGVESTAESSQNPPAADAQTEAAIQKAEAETEKKIVEKEKGELTEKEKQLAKSVADFIQLPAMSAEQQKALYIRLMRARKRFNTYFLRTMKVTLSEDIARLAKELQKKLDLPADLLKQINEVMGSIKLPDNCIIDPDVRKVLEKGDFPLNGKKVTLQEIKKMCADKEKDK